MTIAVLPRQLRPTRDLGDNKIQTATLSLFRFDDRSSRIWAFGQMGLARRDFRAMSACSFWKLCGSGTGEGFAPRPNWAVWAIMAVWPDATTASQHLSDAPVYRRWRSRADAHWSLHLAPISARGSWSGTTPFNPGNIETGPLAVLTRATLRRRHLMRFWAHVPDISAAIGRDPHVAFKIGIGEVPWLHQITFSVWPDTGAMARFARRDGPHARAVRAVRNGDWFAEELYARFRVTHESGYWPGTAPILPRPEAA